MLARVIFLPLPPGLPYLLPAHEKADAPAQRSPYQGRHRTHPDVTRHRVRLEQESPGRAGRVDRGHATGENGGQ